MKLTSKLLQRIVEQELTASAPLRSITESRLRRIVREEIETLSEAAPEQLDVSGNVSALAGKIAKELGDEKLVSPLNKAIKKKISKGGAEAADLQLTAEEKNALGDAFLNLVFTKPEVTVKIASYLKQISVKGDEGGQEKEKK